MACTLIQYRKLQRAFLLVLIEDRGPHVDLFSNNFIYSSLKHQGPICIARCLGLFQGLASTTVSTHCHCHILLLASKLRIFAKKILRKFGTSMVRISIYAISLGLCTPLIYKNLKIFSWPDTCKLTFQNHFSSSPHRFYGTAEIGL